MQRTIIAYASVHCISRCILIFCTTFSAWHLHYICTHNEESDYIYISLAPFRIVHVHSSSSSLFAKQHKNHRRTESDGKEREEEKYKETLCRTKMKQTATMTTTTFNPTMDMTINAEEKKKITNFSLSFQSFMPYFFTLKCHVILLGYLLTLF